MRKFCYSKLGQKSREDCRERTRSEARSLARQRETAHLAIRPGVRRVRERARRADLVTSSSCSALSIDTTITPSCVASGSSVGRNINVGRDLEPVDHLRSGCWRGAGGSRIGCVGATGVGPRGRGRSCGAHTTENVGQYWRAISGLVVCTRQNGPCSCATTIKVCQFGEAKS